VIVALTPTAGVRARVRDCRYGGWGDKAERGGGGGEAEVRGQFFRAIILHAVTRNHRRPAGRRRGHAPPCMC
jgi:hypothetical protein